MLRSLIISFCALLLLSGCSASREKNYDSSYMTEFQRTVGDKVFFALNSSELSSDARSTLMRQAKWLGDHQSVSVIVEGHCDERGTREYNLALGERRAEAVRKFLMSQGVSEDRINTISYGKERPAVMGNNEEAWSRNRRAVSVVK